MLKLRKALLQTINSLEEELEQEKQKNNDLQRDRLILLDTNQELRDKIKDLENNIEFLSNKVPTLKKKRASSKNKESKN